MPHNKQNRRLPSMSTKMGVVAVNDKDKPIADVHLEDFADLMLHVGPASLPVHQHVVCSQSEVIREAIVGRDLFAMQHEQAKIFKVDMAVHECVTLESVQAFVLTLYGQINEASLKKHYLAVLLLAHNLKCRRALAIAMQVALSAISVTKFWATFDIADRIKDTSSSLMEGCLSFVRTADNLSVVNTHTVQRKKCVQGRPHLLERLLDISSPLVGLYNAMSDEEYMTFDAMVAKGRGEANPAAIQPGLVRHSKSSVTIRHVIEVDGDCAPAKSINACILGRLFHLKTASVKTNDMVYLKCFVYVDPDSAVNASITCRVRKFGPIEWDTKWVGSGEITQEGFGWNNLMPMETLVAAHVTEGKAVVELTITVDQ